MLGIGLVLRSVRRLTALVLVSVAAALVQPLPAGAQAQEFRAFWVDAFHAGFKNSAQVTTLIATVREANCNAVVVEIRKRGDAYYTPDTGYADYEPHATDTDPANFDSLADLVGKAHDTSGGKARVEVHAWLVTWPIWGSTTAPSNPQHPYNRHPEWLTQNTSGTTWNGNQYCFDPGHPGAFEHTFRIAISLVTNYDLDGINFDYVRYAGNTWGYNPTAVSRFHARYGGSGNPLSTDPNWLQFRRDQVTAFVRKVYLNTIARKPNVKVSADTITWAPGPANLSAWYASARAYHDVLQDWRAWMQEGILDLNIPMAYFNQAGSYTQDWTNWCDFIRDNQYGRHAVIGPGLYLNGTADAIRQMRYARTPSPSGNSVRGVCGYSYAVPDADSIPFGTFLQYLTSTPNAYDSVTPALFAQPASIPAMPWKTSPATGHLMGTVFSGAFGNAADGAVVTITGPATSRTQTNDGSGFYGFVDLPPGPYTVRAALPGLTPVTNTVSVVSGVVTNVNLIVSTNDITPPAISGVHALNISDTSVTIAWSTDENADSRVDYGLTTSYGATVTNGLFTRDHSVALTALAPGTLYHYRVTSIDPLGNEAVSGDFTFTTNPSGVVNDIIIDNPAASVNGAWGTGNSAGDRFGADYRFKSQGAGAAYLQYTPTIVTAGTYQVYEWHSVGGNRTTNAPFSIRFDGGSQTVFVNEKVSGGSWNLLGTFRFAVGTGGYIRITDGFADAGQVVIADAVKFVYVPPLLGPSITAQPQSQSVKATSNATFTVSAAGTTPLSFQWLFESTRIPNATANSYTRLSVRTNDAGSYFVLIANAAGSVTSSPAVLSVIPLQPPLIVEQPRSQFAVTGGSASFSVVASSASPLQYQWFFNGAQLSNRTELPLSLPDVQAADFGTYHVQLRNEDGTVLSNPAVLGLASAPEITALLTNGTHFNVAFDTEPGPTYSLEYNRVLTGEPWQTLTNIAGNGSTASFDDILSSEPTRLYRVRIR